MSQHAAVVSSMSAAPVDAAALAEKVAAAMPDVGWCAHLMKDDQPTAFGEFLSEFLTAAAPENPQHALNAMKKVGLFNVSGFDRVRVRHQSRARQHGTHACARGKARTHVLAHG